MSFSLPVSPIRPPSDGTSWHVDLVPQARPSRGKVWLARLMLTHHIDFVGSGKAGAAVIAGTICGVLLLPLCVVVVGVVVWRHSKGVWVCTCTRGFTSFCTFRHSPLFSERTESNCVSYLCLWVSQSVRPSICLSVCLSVYLSVSLLIITAISIHITVLEMSSMTYQLIQWSVAPTPVQMWHMELIKNSSLLPTQHIM